MVSSVTKRQLHDKAVNLSKPQFAVLIYPNSNSFQIYPTEQLNTINIFRLAPFLSIGTKLKIYKGKFVSVFPELFCGVDVRHVPVIIFSPGVDVSKVAFHQVH